MNELRDNPERLRQAVSVDIEIALNKVGILLTAEQGNVAADAAIATVMEDTGWQDIATAPRDGTPIDLWVVFPDGGHRWANAKWMEAGEHSCTGPSNWCSSEKFPLHAFTEKPIATHWKPLDPPPPFEGTKP